MSAEITILVEFTDLQSNKHLIYKNMECLTGVLEINSFKIFVDKKERKEK